MAHRTDDSGKGHTDHKAGHKAGHKKGSARRQARLDAGIYEAELLRLQAELVALQEWVRSTGARVLIIFEGRDAAGKGSAIKRVTEYLNPRFARIVALPAASRPSKMTRIRAPVLRTHSWRATSSAWSRRSSAS